MDINTGEIHYFEDNESKQKFENKIGYKLLAITDNQAKKLISLSKRKRKFLMNNKPCPCLSGKSFKKCCARKYKK